MKIYGNWPLRQKCRNVFVFATSSVILLCSLRIQKALKCDPYKEGWCHQRTYFDDWRTAKADKKPADKTRSRETKATGHENGQNRFIFEVQKVLLFRFAVSIYQSNRYELARIFAEIFY